VNDTQAQEVVLLIRAATGGRVEENTVTYFTAALQALDYDLGLAAATVGTITWRKFPSWAEFKEVYRAQKRLAEPVGEQRQDLPLGGRDEPSQKRGEAAAEWVWVWSWARLQRSPTETRMFPQQESQSDPTTIMTTDDYEELRKEWKLAGSPKSKNPLPMAR
jgi:hypothetical protein